MANRALFRATTSNAAPVKGGEFLADRGPGYTSGPRYHQGKDTPIPVGTPLYASGAGIVVAASATNKGSAGWYVAVAYVVDGVGTVKVETYHMSRVDVRVGQSVAVTTMLGLSGGKKGAPGAGSSNGPHVHTEVHVNGRLVNPDDYLNPRSMISGGGSTPIPAPAPAFEEDDEMHLTQDTPSKTYFLGVGRDCYVVPGQEQANSIYRYLYGSPLRADIDYVFTLVNGPRYKPGGGTLPPAGQFDISDEDMAGLTASLTAAIAALPPAESDAAAIAGVAALVQELPARILNEEAERLKN